MLLRGLVAVAWAYYKRTRLGLGAYAIGSAPEAAYMSGVRIKQVKLGAYALAGFFSAAGGPDPALQTGARHPDIPHAGGDHPQHHARGRQRRAAHGRRP